MDQQQTQPEDSIQVFVRIKPGCEDEAVLHTTTEIKLEKHTFAFDRIFPGESQQEDIFNAVGKKLLMNVLEGYNSCVFVYGQTGSGKTWTMMGDNSGLMQRSFRDLFSRLNRLAESECIVTCSYYELYNEQINDLLDNRKDKKTLNIRQDVKRGVFVENLTEQSALNSDKLLECLNAGMKNRHIGETMMNRESSRSHSIFTISLVIKSEIDGKKVMKIPKLHFVDLAGSERQKMTMASGDRLKEAGNINKSLTTLGMVINALASDKAKTHIPYRDSKLTCLLRDSLGGNSKTFIVATISNSNLSFQETLSTLNFANRAKMVKVKALINEESLSTNLEQFKEEIRKLKREILRLKTQKKVNFQHPPATDSILSKNNEDLQHKLSQLSVKLTDMRTNMTTTSPNMDNIIELLTKNNNKSIDRMEDENNTNRIEEEGNQLVEYMLSNHELLKKIHSAVNEYASLKEEINHVEINRRMPLEKIRTPSKFERDQYQELLGKRESEIKMLEERIVALKESGLRKEGENRDLRRKLISMEDHTESKEETLSRVQSDQEDLEQRYSELHLKYEMVAEEKLKNQKTAIQLESRLKQSKQLYVYAEQKYQTQKSMRSKLESSIKQLSKKIHCLEQQKKQIIDDYETKLYSVEEKTIEGERRLEELKTQLDILSETVEFDQKKMKQYSDRVSECNKVIQELNLSKFQIGEQLTQNQHEKQGLVNEYEHVVGELRLKKKQIENSSQLLEEELKRSENRNGAMSQEYETLKDSSKEKIYALEADLQTQTEMARSLGQSTESTRLETQKLVYSFESKLFQLQKSTEHMKTELDNQHSTRTLIEKKYTNDSEQWAQQIQRLTTENLELTQSSTILHEQSMIKTKRIEDLQLQVLSTKNIVEQFDQLRKTYKEVIKQNYKLKGEHSSNSSNCLSQASKNEELVSKVSYYEQKFRLMSLEYNKVQEVGKKLKQKELTLIKKLEYFEQSDKLNKFHSSSETEELKVENYKMLQLENDELKESLNKITKLNQTKMQNEKKEDYSKRLNLEHFKYELEQKEERIKKRLENAIRNWDHAKENSCLGMNLEELLGCWEKIEHESRKKIEGIHRSIKREQKLKIQNGFIIKQNTYLKQKADALEREMNLSALGQPRKLIKLDQD